MNTYNANNDNNIPIDDSLNRAMEFSFRDSANLNTEKDYYNDLPGKLPPELLDPVENIPPQRPQSFKKLTLQVSIGIQA